MNKNTNVIFLLTHNYNVRGKSKGVNGQNHRLYELTVKNSETKYMLHSFEKDGQKIIAIEHNADMTVTDCKKLNMLGNIFKKCGYTFECDEIIEDKQELKISKSELNSLNLVGDKKTKSEADKIQAKIEKLQEKLKVLKD